MLNAVEYLEKVNKICKLYRDCADCYNFDCPIGRGYNCGHPKDKDKIAEVVKIVEGVDVSEFDMLFCPHCGKEL